MRRLLAICSTGLLALAVALPAAATTEADGIEGAVWLDLDGNGRQDAGEPGRAGVAVSLRTTATIIDAAVTDADGIWRFDRVQPGAYTVVVVPPIDHQVTTDQRLRSESAEIDVDLVAGDAITTDAVGLGSPVASGPDATVNVVALVGDATTGEDERGWHVGVHNIGPGTATGPADVRLVLSGGHTAVAATGDGWVCDLGDSIVSCDLAGSVEAASSLPPLQVTTTMTGALGTTVSLRATAQFAGVFDAAPLNDEDEAETTVAAIAETADIDGDGEPDLSNAGAPAALLPLAMLVFVLLGLGSTGLASTRRS